MAIRIQSGSVEPLYYQVLDELGQGLTGLTGLQVRVSRISDDYVLDWNDATFKASGWTTPDKPVVEVGATDLPGLYKVTGGLDTGAITNPAANDTLLVTIKESPAVNGILVAALEVKVGQWVDQVDAILTDTADMQPRVVAIEADTNETQTKLPTNNIMGSSVKTDKDDEIDAILADTAAMEPLVSTNLDATVSSRESEADAAARASTNQGEHDATQAAIAALNDLDGAGVQAALTAQGYTITRAPYLDELAAANLPADVDAILADTSAIDGRLPSDPADESLQQAAHAQTQADIAALNNLAQSDILSDATPFAGANIAAILADTAAIDARLPADPADESSQTAQHTQTQADIAALNDPTPSAIADAVWDETTAGHLTLGTTGKALSDASAAGPSASAIADAVWDEALSGHAVAGSTGEALTDASASSATPAAIADAVWDELASGHVGAGSLGAELQAKAEPGDSMALVANAVDGTSLSSSAAAEIADSVWDEALSGHAGAGSAGQTLTTRAAPGAAMDLVSGAVDATAIAADGAQEIADAVWDEPIAGHLAAGTTGAAVDRIDGRVDTTVSSRAVTGAAMTLAASAITSTVLDTSAVNEIADGVWDEALAGHAVAGSAGAAQARVDVAVSTRAAVGAAMTLTTGERSSIADAVWDEAIAGHSVAGSAGKVMQDAADTSLVADAVWDEPAAGHVGAGTMGQLESRLDAAVSSRAAPGDAMDLVNDAVDGASLAAAAAQEIADQVWEEALGDHSGTAGSTAEALNSVTAPASPAVIADAVWDEALAGHAGAGSAGEAAGRLDATISSRAAPGAAMDLVTDALDAAALAAGAVTEIQAAILSDAIPFAGAAIVNLDAAISSRSIPGSAMTLTPGERGSIVDGVFDEPLSGHVAAGSAGEALGRVDAQVSSRAAPGASMGLTGGALSSAADAVWDESLAAHSIAGSTGAGLQAAGAAVDTGAIADAVWDEDLSGHAVAGTAGVALDDAAGAAGQMDKIDGAATAFPPTPGSLLDRLVNKSAGQTYDPATDSLEAIRDKIGGLG